MNGHLKIYRSFFSHWIWEDNSPFSRRDAWIDLLQLAAFAPTKRIVRDKLIELDRGELIASLRYLSVRWKWGKDKVSKFLKMLEADGMTRQQNRQGETVLIICNYKDFADRRGGRPDSNADDAPHSEPTEARQRPDSEPTKDKKVEEDKELKETPKPPRGQTPSAQSLIDAIPSDWSEGYRAIAAEWAQDKQSRGPTKQRIQTMRSWEITLKRMAAYPLKALTESIEKAIASGWQGWEHESTKKHFKNGNTKGNPRSESEAFKESTEIKHL